MGYLLYRFVFSKKAKEKRRQRKLEKERKQQAIVVECPYCHSTKTKKITTSSKVINTLAFGVFATSSNVKEWHCDNCNSNF